MGKIGLTQAQKQAYDFILAYCQTHEIAPSFDEIRQEVWLKSKSGVHRIVAALVERGYIRKLPHRARAIWPVAQVDAAAPNSIIILKIKGIVEAGLAGEVAAIHALRRISETLNG